MEQNWKNVVEESLWAAIDRLQENLSAAGYARETMVEYIRAARHFCYWYAGQAPLEAIDESTVEAFLRHRPSCTCPVRKWSRFSYPAGAKHFLAVLRQMGLASHIEKAVLPEDGVLEAFLEHMTKVRGAAVTTALVYVQHLRPFLQSIYIDGKFPFSALTARDVEAWVARRAERCRPKTAKLSCSALRAFFRFLRLRGEIALPLDEAVPAVPHWSLSTVPKYLREEELAAFLSSFNVNTLSGLRDRAMALLMATAGLRATEVAGLTFEDIDWRKSSIRLRGTKSRRTDYVPLTSAAGEALAAYVQRRPPTETRHVFLALVPPAGRPITLYGVTRAMSTASTRCFPDRPARGAHALRHTLATGMLGKGATYKEIADMLRHRDIGTTGIYAKVDFQGLAHAVLPWPEVTS